MPRAVIVATGVVTLLCALFGLLYTAQSLAVSLGGGFGDLARHHQMTHFYPAFYLMSAVSIACYVALLWGAFQLTRQRFSYSGLLIGVWLFEIVYFLAVGLLFRSSQLGASVAGATGVANGGMMAQFFILLPVWGPIAVLWTKRRYASTNAI